VFGVRGMPMPLSAAEALDVLVDDALTGTADAVTLEVGAADGGGSVGRLEGRPALPLLRFPFLLIVPLNSRGLRSSLSMMN